MQGQSVRQTIGCEALLKTQTLSLLWMQGPLKFVDGLLSVWRRRSQGVLSMRPRQSMAPSPQSPYCQSLN